MATSIFVVVQADASPEGATVHYPSFIPRSCAPSTNLDSPAIRGLSSSISYVVNVESSENSSGSLAVANGLFPLASRSSA